MARLHSRNRLQRRRPAREPYDRVLIVCEGEKSEPIYFKDLVRRRKLNTANVVVVGVGTEPRSLVDEAKRRKEGELRRGDQYDAVYCVFDRDKHAHFNAASDNARAAGLKLARSWPCFEYWLVVHFVYHRRPYGPSGNRTASQNCVRELQGHLSDYTKGRAVYDVLEDRLENAKSNAQRALMDAKETRRHNPSTEVHCLVAYLQALGSGG